jgi:dipeptidyl aminopeptidase/acylaminoacyl peptidase
LGTHLSHRFIVYYQVFSHHGIVESKHPFRDGDPHTARVIASHITPPHNVKFVKMFLCKQENIPDIEHTNLFTSISSDSELDGLDRLRLLAADGPGSDADDPIVLVVKDIPHASSSDASSSALSNQPPPPILLRPFSPTPLQIRSHKKRLVSVCFSPDGSKIVSGSYDGKICIWDIASSKVVIRPISVAGLNSVAISSDGQQIASGGYRKPFIRLWNAHTGRRVSRQFDGHTAGVTSVAFSPDGRRIASASGDKTIRIWDTQLVEVLVGPFHGQVSSVVFSPNGTSIASAAGGTYIHLSDAKTGALIAGPFVGYYQGGVNAVAFSPQGQWIASGLGNKGIGIWDTKVQADTGVSRPSRCFTGNTNIVYSVAFSPDGQWLASCGQNGEVRIWNFESGQTVTILSSRSALWSVAISPKGDCIASGGDSGEVSIWKRE